MCQNKGAASSIFAPVYAQTILQGITLGQIQSEGFADIMNFFSSGWRHC